MEIYHPKFDELLREMRRVRREKKRNRLLWGLGIWLTLSLVAGWFIFNRYYTLAVVRGPAMGETMPDGTLALVRRTPEEGYRRGDILLFERGDGWQVKRLLALPEDRIVVSPYSENPIRVNGEALKETYTVGRTADTGATTRRETLGEDEYFVCGDQRSLSVDSRNRDYGLIKKESIVGRADFILWPVYLIGEVNGEDYRLNFGSPNPEEPAEGTEEEETTEAGENPEAEETEGEESPGAGSPGAETTETEGEGSSGVDKAEGTDSPGEENAGAAEKPEKAGDAAVASGADGASREREGTERTGEDGAEARPQNREGETAKDTAGSAEPDGTDSADVAAAETQSAESAAMRTTAPAGTQTTATKAAESAAKRTTAPAGTQTKATATQTGESAATRTTAPTGTATTKPTATPKLTATPKPTATRKPIATATPTTTPTATPTVTPTATPEEEVEFLPTIIVELLDEEEGAEE